MNLDKSRTFQDFLFQVPFSYFWVLGLYKSIIFFIDCGYNWPHSPSKHCLEIELTGPHFISYTHTYIYACTLIHSHTPAHLCTCNTHTQEREKIGPALNALNVVSPYLFFIKLKRFCVGRHSWCLLASMLQQSSPLLITAMAISTAAMPTRLPRSTKVLALSTAQAALRYTVDAPYDSL